ncbi:MAG: DUF4384 domain-containing protein, partial [Planctomycetes bacterium]|nr:DUF4384 domain-containing protein [Planctomycetota bacterium]
VCLVTLSLFCGCATEARIRQSGPEPSWRWDGEKIEGDQRLYVGISVADNVLDETQARRLALANAAENAARSLSVKVTSQLAQVTKRIGPAHKGQNEAEEFVESQLKAFSDEIIRGLHPREWYSEKWEVREGFMGEAFTRYKWFVQAAYPQEQYDRVMRAIIDKLESSLDFLLPRIQSALDAGDIPTALKCAQRATLRHADVFQAWWALYRVQKAAGDWRKAIEVLRKAHGSADSEKNRRLASETLLNVGDRLVGQLRKEAEQTLKAGKHTQSLRTLEEAWRAAKTRSLRSAVSQQYYDVLAEAVAAEVASQARGSGLEKVALSTFLESHAHTRAEAQALKEAVGRKLRDDGRVEFVIKDVSRDDAEKILKGQWRALGDLQKKLAAENIQGLIVAELGREITLRLGNVKKTETTLLASGRSLEAIRGRPDLPIWETIDKLIPPNPVAAFNVAVWTRRQEYRQGDTVEIHFKADANCYVYIIDIGTSGGMYLLYPNAFHPSGAAVGGKEHVIPDPADGYEIPVSGPAGWEGLKVIATVRPIDLGIEVKGPAIKIDDTQQREFVKKLADQLRKMRPQDWAEGAWEFFVW